MIIHFDKKNWAIKSEISIKQIFESLKEWNYSMEVKRIRNKRSTDQNRYFHWVIVPMIAEYMGTVSEYWWDNKQGLEDAKEAIINYFLPSRKLKNPIDKRKKVTFQKRTSDCDTKEFSEFTKKILEKFPFIPPPDDGSINSLLLHYSQKYENL